jgi:F-type H+-transporting ATPase subunit epsilon
MKLKVSILTPDGIVLKRDDIDEVILPTSTGQIGILPNHASLVTGIEIGVLRLRVEDAWSPFIAFGGVAAVGKNVLQVLLTTIEEVPSLEIEEAKNQLSIFRDEAKKAITPKEKLTAYQNLKKSLATFQAINFINSIKQKQ